jgi:hypothetical protein
MRKILLCLGVLFGFVGVSLGQLNLEWANSTGGSMDDDANSMALDNNGNVLIIGSFDGTVDFNPGSGVNNITSLSQSGFNDMFIQKLDQSGNLIWVKSLGNIDGDIQGNKIIVDQNDNIYITGFYSKDMDFDPGSGVQLHSSTNLTMPFGSFPTNDIFILKLNNLGEFQWVNTFGDIGQQDEGIDILIDDSGFVYLTGLFSQTVDFDPGSGAVNLTSTNSSINDIFLLRLDSNGNLMWAKNCQGKPYEMAFDNSYVIYTVGSFSGTSDLEPGTGTTNLTSAGSSDIFIQKMDTLGNFIWAKQIGGSSVDQANCIAFDKSNNAYVSGSFRDTVDFNPGVGVYNLIGKVNNNDIFILKLDSSAQFVWAHKIGDTTGAEQSKDIMIDNSGNVFLTGTFTGTVDFNPGTNNYNLISNGLSDYFLLKLDSASNFEWADNFDFYNLNFFLGNSDNVYLSGTFYDSLDFNMTADEYKLYSNGSRDIFVAKYTDCLTATSYNVLTACNSFTWINGVTYNGSGSFPTVFNLIHTIDNGAINGCDSIVNLNLTLISNISIVTQNGSSITANQNSASYQCLDCNNNFDTISGAVSQTFSPLINGSYAVEITSGQCIDTSNCIQVTSVPIHNIFLNSNFKVLPNPTTGKINLELGELKDVSIRVHSIDGQLIYSEENINESTFDFDIKDAASGLYIIEVEANEGKIHYKLIKQ